jgi:hypothetical protein
VASDVRPRPEAAELCVGRAARADGTLPKLLRIPQALFGIVVIAMTVIAALLAPWIVPVDAEEMDF